MSPNSKHHARSTPEDERLALRQLRSAIEGSASQIRMDFERRRNRSGPRLGHQEIRSRVLQHRPQESTFEHSYRPTNAPPNVAFEESGADETQQETADQRSPVTAPSNEGDYLSQLHRDVQQALGQFDADIASGSRLEVPQSSNRIGASPAELLKQPDSEANSTRESQLIQQLNSAGDAGEHPTDALHLELQRTNLQASSLTGESTKPDVPNDVTTHLVEVSKKLDDAAIKLDKALSNMKNVVLMKE